MNRLPDELRRLAVLSEHVPPPARRQVELAIERVAILIGEVVAIPAADEDLEVTA
jgi:hypothetical protein